MREQRSRWMTLQAVAADGRTELAQVLARLQDDTLQEPDRQLLMHLGQQ